MVTAVPQWEDVPLPPRHSRELEAVGAKLGKWVRRPVRDGELRVLSATIRGLRMWSASIGRPGERVPFRSPTDHELELVRALAAINVHEAPGGPCVRVLLEYWDDQAE